MGPDVKIRHRCCAHPAPPSIYHEALPRQKACLPRQWLTSIDTSWKCVVQCLDRRKPNRHLRVDNRIHNKSHQLDALGKRIRRPFSPPHIVRRNIQQNIAIDQHTAATLQAAAQSNQRLTHPSMPGNSSFPRVNAIISSVLNPASEVPRSASSARRPRCPVPLLGASLRSTA